MNGRIRYAQILAVMFVPIFPIITLGATEVWAPAVSGNWSDATKWSPQVVPNNGNPSGVTYDAVVTAPSSGYQIDVDIPIALDSLTLNSPNANIQVFKTLAVGNITVTAGSMDIYGAIGGKIINASITVNSGAMFSSIGGVFDNDLLSSGTVVGSTGMTIQNGIVLQNATIQSYADVGFTGNQSITGSGLITLYHQTNINPSMTVNGALTVGSGITIAGFFTSLSSGTGGTITNYGTILGDQVTISPQLFINYGTLLAQGSGGITIQSPWHNLGVIQINSGSALNIWGDFKTSDLGTIENNGGYINISATLDNRGTTLNLSSGSCNWSAYGTILGGRIITSDASAMTLLNVTLQDVTVGPSNSEILALGDISHPLIQGILTLDNGEILIGGGVLDFQNGSSLAGNGTFIVGSNGTIRSNGTTPLQIPSGINILSDVSSTKVPSITIGRAGSDIENDGIITSSGNGNHGSKFAIIGANITNHGTITASNGGSLSITGNLINPGSIAVDAGLLTLTINDLDNGILTSIQRTNGGMVAITGVNGFANSSLALSSATGDLGLLNNATLSNVTITSTGSAKLRVLGPGNGCVTLDHVILGSDLQLDQGTTITLASNVTLQNAMIKMSSSSYFSPSSINYIIFKGNTGVDGTGEIIAENPQGSYILPNETYQAIDTLTLGPGITVKNNGASLVVGGNFPDHTSYVDNQGIISSESSGKTITLTGNAVSNEGNLFASNNGTLVLINVSNSLAGVISASNATIGAEGTFSNAGVMILNNALLEIFGSSSLGGSINLTNSTVMIENASAINPTAVISRTNGLVVLACTFAPASGSFDLASTPWGALAITNGAFLSNAVLTNSAGTISIIPGRSPDSAVFHNMALGSDVELSDSASLMAEYSLNLANAKISINGVTQSTILNIQGTQHIAGNGVIESNGIGSGSLDMILINSGMLTTDANITIRTGTGNMLIQTTGSDSGWINKGTILAQGSENVLTIDASNFDNQGLLKVNPGASLVINNSFSNEGQLVVMAGSLTLAPYISSSNGTLQITDSYVQLKGSWNATQLAALPLSTNTIGIPHGTLLDFGGTTLALTNSNLSIGGATLSNGTLTNISGATVLFTSTNTLSHLNLNIPSQLGVGSILNVGSTFILNDVLIINAGFGIITSLTFAGNSTTPTLFTGNGEIVFNGVSSNGRLTYSGSGGTVLFDNGVKIRTGNTSGLISMSAATLTLAGSISSDVPGFDLSVTSRAMFQQGMVHVGEGASLHFSVNRTLTNTGSIIVDGGTLYTSTGWSNLSGTLLASDGGAFVFGQGQGQSGTVTLTSPLVLQSSVVLFNDIAQSATTISGTGFVMLGDGQKFTSDGVTAASLALGSNATHTIRLNGSTQGASKLSALTLASDTSGHWTSTLNITNNALILANADTASKATELLTLQNQVASGRNGGDWLGKGITSSTITANTTLAIADNGDLHLSAFRGQTIDDNALIVVQAQMADGNLDGKVNSLDLTTLANHWQQQSGALWTEGDFNGDGKVDSLDLTVLANNWQFGGAGLGADGNGADGAGGDVQSALTQVIAQPAGPTQVPEPGTLWLAAGVLPWMLRRRRGKGRGMSGVGRV